MKREMLRFAALAVLLATSWPTAVQAADCVLETTSNYTVMLEGTNKLRLKFPVYDKDGSDCWIVEGTITIKLNGTGDEATLFYNTSGGSMNVIARVEGIELMEGDQLVAYDGNGEVRGVASNQAQLFFLSVGRGDKALSFDIERDGETVATTTQQMSYEENGVQGTLDNPAVISFVPMDSLEGEGWYSIQGFKLIGKPIQKGVYIHNGQRILIK
ncbi:MAG: hypothetical protein IJ767_01070 [Bacteroidaceae bacterium]|nr:hypothetical protein [Bacteroidaceae bacterium]